MNKWLFKRLIVGGLVLFVIVVVIYLVTKPKETNETSEATAEVQEETLALAQEFDEDGSPEKNEAKIVDEDSVDSEEAPVFDMANHGFVLNIATNDLAVYAPVFDGVVDRSLSRGVGRHLSTALPNETTGNVVLSGHQWYPGDAPGYKVFENLDSLSKDDDVSLQYGGKKYTYKVREVKVVEPTDVSILEQTENPQLTLYTCYPRFSTEKRLVYVADLISVDEV